MGTPVSASSGSWANIPEAILQVLGTYLDAQGWAAARSTCKGWKNITANIHLLEIDMERDAHRWMMVLMCVGRLFPRLSSVVLLISNRITPVLFRERMASLAVTDINVQELELRFVYASNPRIGSWLHDLSPITELRHLKVLRLSGGATPPVEVFAALSKLQQLTMLEVLPGLCGQIYEMDADLASANSQGVGGGDGGLTDGHLAAVATLTQLKQLIVKVSPSDCTASGLLSLAEHGLLNNLEHLALYDAELPSKCLLESVGRASRLTSLQLGLSNVEDLSTLALLPKLQDLSLDTAYLPDLRELVYAAARGNIPRSGPGSITGLCLMDQVIDSPLQLAALSQLSSLSELVIINPIAEPIQALQDLEEDQYDILDPQQQQQQQQQPIVIDLACLSGLTNLDLLQIDLRQPDQWIEDLDLHPSLQRRSLHPMFSAAAVRQLAAAAWRNLGTLDLSGFTSDLLPEAAIVGFSELPSLQNLSIMTDSRVFGDHGGSAAWQQQLQQQQQQRRLGWWQLPKGLTSLCLSHFDLSVGAAVGSSSSSSSSEELTATDQTGMHNVQHDNITKQLDQQTPTSCRLKKGAFKNHNKPQVAVNSDQTDCILSACGSSSCCLAYPRQQQQQTPTSGFSRMQSFLNPGRISPLKTLGSKRRRESPEHSPTPDPASTAAGGGSPAAAADSGSSSSSGCSGDGSTVAIVRGEGLSEVALEACPCAARVAAHFPSLRSLWLEHCTLPMNLLPLVLPSLRDNLEALALLHVSGPRPDDLRLVSGLTSLTSLRLVPEGHGRDAMWGLEGLVPLKHLKRLSFRLSQLHSNYLAVLPQLRSLFCISIAKEAPLGKPSAVSVQQVVDVVRDSLPYCDVEVQS